MDNLKREGVIILDFGSQYTQLIARRVRENSVFSEVLSCDTSMEQVDQKKPKAIIGDQIDNSIGILSVWPKANERSLR